MSKSRNKTTDQPREYKAVPQHLKVDDESPNTYTGVFSVFGVLDSYGDIVHPGAFAKTIQERKSQIFHLWQHNFNSPAIATIDELREIAANELPDEVRNTYPEATGGILVKRTYLDTPRAQEILAGLAAKVPYQMSFAYDAIKYDFEEDTEGKTYWGEIRHLREVRLYETSDVLWGANSATRADVFKSLLNACKSQRLEIDQELADLLAPFIQQPKATPDSSRAAAPALTDLKAKLGIFDLGV